METSSARSETSSGPRASAGRQTQLRRCRLVANLTQQQLADRSGGVARRTICRIETGRQRPSLEMAAKIADGLGLDIRVVFPEAGLTFAEQNERTAGLTGPEKLAGYRALPPREQDEISRNIAASPEGARPL